MIQDQAIPTAEARAAGIRGRLLALRDGARANNLPLPLTSFVGRVDALAQVRELLAVARLLTLTGPGGVGKTRLALEAAFALFDGFKDGAWWVDLAPLCDDTLLPDTVALALGLPDDPTRSKAATLSDYLRDKDLLLVLDNCEQVIGACAELAEQLLRTCAKLHILATSREERGSTARPYGRCRHSPCPASRGRAPWKAWRSRRPADCFSNGPGPSKQILY
jgi:hypothetical protein